MILSIIWINGLRIQGNIYRVQNYNIYLSQLYASEALASSRFSSSSDIMLPVVWWLSSCKYKHVNFNKSSKDTHMAISMLSPQYSSKIKWMYSWTPLESDYPNKYRLNFKVKFLFLLQRRRTSFCSYWFCNGHALSSKSLINRHHNCKIIVHTFHLKSLLIFHSIYFKILSWEHL